MIVTYDHSRRIENRVWSQEVVPPPKPQPNLYAEGRAPLGPIMTVNEWHATGLQLAVGVIARWYGDYGIMGLRDCGIKGLWDYGIMGLWDYGIPAHCTVLREQGLLQCPIPAFARSLIYIWGQGASECAVR